MLMLTAEKALQHLLMQILSGKQFPLITISGGTRSGKSTFSKHLREVLMINNVSVSLIGLDDYFRDFDDPLLPLTREGSRVFDLPQSYHEEEFVQHVLALLLGNAVNMPSYDKCTTMRVASIFTECLPATVLIAEGLFVGTLLRGVQSAFHVFMDTDKRICLERRIKDDTLEYAVSEEKVRQRFFQKVLPYWGAHIEPQRHFANLIIKN
jgi:uridine kinase